VFAPLHASAEGTWIEAARLSAGVQTFYWSITTIHETRIACRAEMDRVIEEVAEQQRRAGARAMMRLDEDRLANRYESTPFARRTATTVRWLCLPDTTDPRGSKAGRK
jgi:hypothetical protein